MRLARNVLTLALSVWCAGTFAATPASDTSSANVSAQPQATAGADNSRINARDKDSATLTPQNQPNAAGDRKTLAAVRRAVVHDKSLSTSAHNVKIVASAGVVTLRGPVNSEEEKGKIEKLAGQVAGVSSVDNQLDVKSK